MNLGRTLLLGGVVSAAIAMLAPTAASAHWHESGNAFARLACWYAGGNPSYAPGPGPTFGYGGPSCWDREVIRIRRHVRERPLRVRG
jgi:hypothetical protein